MGSYRWIDSRSPNQRCLGPWDKVTEYCGNPNCSFEETLIVCRPQSALSASQYKLKESIIKILTSKTLLALPGLIR